jgi:hypothetical protein
MTLGNFLTTTESKITCVFSEVLELDEPSMAHPLNLELVWARLKSDRPDRCFLPHLFLINLRLRLVPGYVPSACLERASGLEDEVIFRALLGQYLGRFIGQVVTVSLETVNIVRSLPSLAV